MRYITLSITLVSLFILPLKAYHQSPNSTTGATQQLIENYLLTTGSHALLYYGKEQLKYPLHYRHHPYYQKPEYVKGSISHNGIQYNNVMLRLDLHRDELVVNSPDPPYNIVIEASQVGKILLHGDTFLSLPLPSTSGNLPHHGYFLLHQNGKYQVLEKINVSLDKVVEWGQLSMLFTANSTLYISVGESLFPVRSLRQLKKIMPERQKDIQRIVRDNRLNFRRNPLLTLNVLMQNLSEE